MAKRTTTKTSTKKTAQKPAQTKGLQWNLERHFYSSLNDPRIVQDLEKGERAVDAFVKKYSADRAWMKDPKALREALDTYEKLIDLSSSSPAYYALYRKELNAKDKEAEAMSNKLDEIYTKRGNKTLFFELELAKVPETTQKKFLKAPELASWRYWLKHLFENAKHNLSEKEERLMSLLGDVSHGRWIQATENILNVRTVRFEGKDIPVNEAFGKVSSLPTPKRRVLHAAIMKELREISDMAESELNAIVTRKKITDELRGFAEPFDATILGYENEKESVLALIHTVSKHFDIAQRFYKAKARMLGEKKITYADRTAPVGEVRKKISFAEAATVVRAAYAKLHPRYAEIFDQLLTGEQVDVYPRLGKTGGAYCSHAVNMPTMVLLNHIDDVHSLLTLAHEMGHAVHSERSKTQRPVYQGYSTVTAETASTFFERCAFEALVTMLSEEERLVALHDRIQDDVSTVFRQIACFNFEKDMHALIRQHGLLPKDQLATLMNKHMASYLGPAVNMTDDDGYFFVAWHHIRRFFYVYSYAYGQLVSRALWARVKENPSYIDTIDKEFFCAGGSASPEDIFGNCGLDVRSPKIFEEGLKSIEQDVAMLEKAIAKRKR